jgi:toxin secretion/phage lysis holin
MDKWEVIYKSVIALTGAVVGYLFGDGGIVLQVLLVFMAFDYLTGFLASGVEGKLSSKVGFKGIAKKLMILCLVAVGHQIDKTVGQGDITQNMVTFFYLGNELLSILENVGRSGLPIPDALKQAVDVLKGKGEGK